MPPYKRISLNSVYLEIEWSELIRPVIEEGFVFLEDAGGKGVQHHFLMQLALGNRKFKELRQHIPTHYLWVLVFTTRAELAYHQLVYSQLWLGSKDRTWKGKLVRPPFLHQLLNAERHWWRKTSVNWRLCLCRTLPNGPSIVDRESFSIFLQRLRPCDSADRASFYTPSFFGLFAQTKARLKAIVLSLVKDFVKCFSRQFGFESLRWSIFEHSLPGVSEILRFLQSMDVLGPAIGNPYRVSQGSLKRKRYITQLCKGGFNAHQLEYNCRSYIQNNLTINVNFYYLIGIPAWWWAFRLGNALIVEN